MADEKNTKTIDAHVDENGKVVEEKKEKFSLKKAWAKAPGWMTKAIKIAGVAGLAAGAYVIGKRQNEAPDSWQQLPELDTEPSEEVTAE